MCNSLGVTYLREHEHRGVVGPVSGISAAEATRRLALLGPNEMRQDEPEPLWRKFLEQFQDPMIGLLGVSALLSLVVGQYDDAVSISLVRMWCASGLSTVTLLEHLCSCIFYFETWRT